MRIAIIQPPHYRFMGSQNRRIFPAVNNVAGMMDKNGHDVKVFNLDIDTHVGEVYATWKVIVEQSKYFFSRVGDSEYYVDLHHWMRSFNPDIVYVVTGDCALPTVDLGTNTAAVQVAERIKDMLDVIVVGVGPRVRENKYFDEIQRTPDFEFGYIDGDKGNFIQNFDIDDFPITTMDYNFYEVAPSNFDYIMSSRGCAFNCDFCLTNMLYRDAGKKLLLMSPKRFVDEVVFRIRRYGICDFYFADAVFDIHAKRTINICNRLQEYDVSWCCEGKADIVCSRPDILENMKKAGCNRMKIGIETNNPDSLGKDVKCSKPEKSIEYIKEAGIKPVAYIMLGGIGMEKSDYMKQLDYMESLGDIEYVLNITTPFKGTDFYSRVEKERDIDRFVYDSPQMSTHLCEFWGIDGEVIERALGLLCTSDKKDEIESNSGRKYVDKTLTEYLNEGE